jgi:hypothetical protein
MNLLKLANVKRLVPRFQFHIEPTSGVCVIILLILTILAAAWIYYAAPHIQLMFR